MFKYKREAIERHAGCDPVCVCNAHIQDLGANVPVGGGGAGLLDELGVGGERWVQ